MRSTVSAAVLFALVLASPISRAAEEDGSAPGWLGAYHPELAARMTFALGSEVPGSFPLTGGGFGVRGGLSYRGFYAGLTYMDYLTNSECLDTGSNTPCFSTHGLSFGAEAGYGHTFFRVLTLRGIVGAGDYANLNTASDYVCNDITNQASTCMTTSSNSAKHSFYVQPEGLVEVSLGPVILGVDASVFAMPGSPTGPFAAFMMGIQAGARL